MSLPSLSSATSTLTPSSGDQSVQLLNNLFGQGWHSYLSHAISGGGSAFFSLLTAFNSVILAGVVIMAAYVYGVGIVGTAHEGKPLGERYHTVWTPLRTVGALFLLAPLPGVGISVIQGLILLLAWFSIGGANFVTKAATDYMAHHAGALALTQPTTSGRQLALATLQAEVTQQYLATFENANFSNSSVFTAGSPDWQGDINKTLKVNPESQVYGNYVYTFSTPDGMQPGAFGHISVPCELDKAGKTLCDARLKAIETMAMTLHPLAVAAVASTLPSKNVAAGTSTTINPALYTTSISDYQQTIADAATKQMSLSNPGYAASLQNALASINAGGWATLGGYYWTINNANQRAQHFINSYPSTAGYDPAVIAASISDKARFTGMLQGLTARLGMASSGAPANSGKGLLTTTLERFVKLPQPPNVSTSTQGTGSNFVTNGQAAGWMANFWSWGFGLDGGDPLARLQAIGNGMFNTVWGGLGLYLTARAINGAANGAERGISGVPVLGAIVNTVAGAGTGAAGSVLNGIAPYLLILFMALLALGFTWAFYLPSVPFILWISAVFGWLIMLIEALVASVLWAAAIGLPQGEGMLGQRGEQGLMLFLNVLFRPALMVVGFFASFVLIDASMRFVGRLFRLFVVGMEVGHVAGLVTFLAIAVIASTLIVTLAHKVFGLVTWIPEHVMRWLGNGVSLGTGEREDEQSTRVMAAGAITRGQHAAGEVQAHKRQQDLAVGNPARPGIGDPSDSGSTPPPAGK